MSVQKESMKDNTTSTTSQCEIVKVFSSVWTDGQNEYITYMSVFDESIVVTAGVEPIPPSWSDTDARKRGIQRSVSHTLDVIEPDGLEVYNHQLDEAGLTLGRLPPDHRSKISELNVSFIESNSFYKKILEGLASFSNKHAPWSHKGNLSEPIKNHAYIYTDGSYYPDNGESAVGYVITDTAGQIYEFGSQSLDETKTRPLIAEFEAIKCGIQRAKERDDVKSITIFTDCMEAVRALNSLGQNDAIPNDATQKPWEIGLEASEIRTVSVSYINRESNQLADALAKRGQSTSFTLLSP